MLPVEQSFKTYTGIDGKPLTNGSVYFGVPGQDPITHPVTVFWDAAGTQPAYQPLRTVNGYIVNDSNAPANVFYDSAYSETVLDSKGRTVFYAPTSDDFSIASFVVGLAKSFGSSLIGFIQSGVGAVKRTVQDKLRDTISVKDFGAVGDGVTDDTDAIQAALDAVKHGGSIYFPKPGGGNGTGPSYKITRGLALAKNDVTLYSDARAEYSEGLVTDQAIDMLTCTGYGTRLQSLAFQGNGSQTTFATTNGVVFDRRVNGDAETYSNLDSQVRDCSFFNLKDGLRGVGRNVFVFDSIFTLCKRGVVGELHTYGGGVNTSDFRGWRISSNRYHSCGAPYIDAGSSEALPANLAALDSWCIQMPQTSGKTSQLEIFDNNCDFCGAGFYKGYLSGAKINGNQTHGGTSIFVYAMITDAPNQSNAGNFVQCIENNTINSRTADQTTDRGYQFSLNSIVVFGVSNLVIAGNTMHNAAQSHLLVTACARATIAGNTFSNGNLLFGEDATTRPCVSIDQSANVTCTDNKVWSTVVATPYSNGIQATTCTNIKFRDNTVLNATTPISAAATDLSKADSDGLPWQTPVPINLYVLGAASEGYRRLFNGFVEVDIQVTAGTDNAIVFTLPVGYRPKTTKTFPAVSIWNDGTDAYGSIDTAGAVIINWNSAPATSYHLRCSFEAA